MIISIVYYGISVVENVEKSSKEQAEYLLNSNKDAILSIVKSWKKSSFFLVQTISKIDDIKKVIQGKRADVSSTLRELSSRESIIAIVLQDINGRVVTSSDRGLNGKIINEKSIDYWNRVTSSHDSIFEKPYISDHKFSSSFNQYAMLVTQPIRSDQGSFIGAVTLIYDPRAIFSEILEKSRYGTTGESYFFDSTGLLLSKSRFLEQLKEIKLIEENEEEIFNLRLYDPKKNLLEVNDKAFVRNNFTLMVESALAEGIGQNIEGYNDYRGVKVIGAWEWLDDLGFGLATEVDFEEAFQDLYLLKRQSQVIAILTIFFTAIYFYIMFLNLKLSKKMIMKNRELAHSEDELRDMLAAADSHAIVSKTDSRGKITYVNKMFCEVSQFSEVELLGQDHRIVNSGKHSKEFFANMWKIVMSKRTWRGVIQNKKKNGDIYWVESTIYPVVDSNSRIKEFVAIRTDITNLKRIEEESHLAKKRAEKAKEDIEKVMFMKSNFIASVSHELRTPLNAIIGYLAAIRFDTSGTPVDEKLEIVEQSSYSLLDLINNTLNLDKLESGKEKNDKKETNLKTLTREIENLYKLGAKQKGLEFVSFYNVGSLKFMIDNVKVKQILNNVINNAIKFTEAGRVSLVVTGEKSKEDESLYDLTIIVSDTGRGMTEEVFNKILNGEQKINEIDASQGTGVGIGLHLVNQYLKIIGGTLAIESKVNVGTTVTITIKKVDHVVPKLDVVESEIGGEGDLSLFSIAVVDDNKINLNMMKLLLRKLGVDAKMYQSPLKFLEEYSENNFDLVFMDQLMPEVKGSEVVKQIRSKYQSRTLFVSLSASTEAEDLALFHELFDDVLTKPVKKEMIETALSRNLVKKVS